MLGIAIMSENVFYRMIEKVICDSDKLDLDSRKIAIN